MRNKINAIPMSALAIFILQAPACPKEAPVLSTPVFEVSIRPAKPLAGEKIAVTLTVKNPGRDPIYVARPEPGNGALTFHFTLPTGETMESPFLQSSPSINGAVKPGFVNLHVLGGEAHEVRLFLTPADAPITSLGNYKLALDYAWEPFSSNHENASPKTGKHWRSPDMTFIVVEK